MPTAPLPNDTWPGKSLGLPRSGPRSIARGGRRLLALVIDWTIASALSYFFFPPEPVEGVPLWTGVNSFATLGIFALLQVVFIATLGGSDTLTLYNGQTNANAIDQAYADAVHNPHFPNVIYSPERPYSHWCEFEIA